jgi:MoxR-like ATPase
MAEPQTSHLETIGQIRTRLKQVIRGKDEVIDLLLNAVLANGHVLLDDVPGVGKTTLAKALALTVKADFKRIQFTSDMMPSDILGSSVFNQQSGEFKFYPGPVFANILLGDEINRASPRTQSALLEAMNEHQVSIEGVRYDLPKPFLVIATENPVEYFGTFPLPEAQLDRFAMKFSLGYPDPAEELAMLNDRWHDDPLDRLEPVISCAELMEIQNSVRAVTMEQSVQEYARELIAATRDQENGFLLGASPRALLDFARCAQARALLNGRQFVTPEDVSSLAVPVLAHRLILNRKSSHAGVPAAELIAAIVKKTRVPV